MSFTGGGMGRRGACTLKGGHFPTPALARVVLEKMGERGAYVDSFEVIRCRYGKRDHWHIAHKMTKDRKGRRK